MKKLLFPCIIIVPFIGFSQKKFDYNWLLGVRTDTGYPENCLNKLDFNNSELKILRDTVSSELFSTNSSISNNQGELLFYSNGCYIKNKNHQIMSNGNNLNPGQVYEDNCPNYGYTANRGLMILPQPGSDHRYYVIHQAFKIFDSPPYYRIDKLYYTVVDMTLNNGLGDVVEKNQLVVEHTQYAGIHAVRHDNGVDWWIIALAHGNNEYFKLLLDEDGLSVVDTQTIGDEAFVNGGGQMLFSPDGTRYAKFDFKNQLMLFDFDRATGQLANYRNVVVTDSSAFGFHGLSFSPSSRFLYLSTQRQLFQYDLHAAEFESSGVLIGEYDGFLFNDLFQVMFQKMQLGPDCRIYMVPHAPAPYLHVINHPDEPGLACGFAQRGIELPCTANYSLPNFPNYRLGTPYPTCDSNIVYVSSGFAPPPPVQEIMVYPNPASGQVTVALPLPLYKGAVWSLCDQLGREVARALLPVGQQEAQLGVEGLAVGLYFWRVEGDGNVLGSGKLIIAK